MNKNLFLTFIIAAGTLGMQANAGLFGLGSTSETETAPASAVAPSEFSSMLRESNAKGEISKNLETATSSKFSTLSKVAMGVGAAGITGAAAYYADQKLNQGQATDWASDKVFGTPDQRLEKLAVKKQELDSKGDRAAVAKIEEKIANVAKEKAAREEKIAKAASTQTVK